MTRPSNLPVTCPDCDAPFPRYHVDDDGWIDCQSCGPVPVTQMACLRHAQSIVAKAGGDASRVLGRDGRPEVQRR